MATNPQLLELFYELRNQLMVKQTFQKTRREVYEGKNEAETLGVALPRSFDIKLRTHLGWGKTAVDTLLQDTVFDGFQNDVLGFTRLLNDFKAYRVIESAQRNSAIGACSFVTVLPRGDGTPIFTAYSGAEATGLWDSRDGFIAGLVKNSVSKPFESMEITQDWLLFLPGIVFRMDDSGVILAHAEMPTERMLFIPFIYEQDVAVKPFGVSRLNTPFINAMESALRTLKLIEVGHDVRIAIRNVLLAEGTNPEDLKRTESDIDMTKLLAIFSENGGSLKIEQLTGPSTDELQQMLGLLAANAATAVGMEATAFGFQPSNGSFNETVMDRISKPYTNLVRRTKEGWGESIKELAITAMALSTGQYDRDWETINPAYLSSVSIEKFGAIADGIGKLQMAAPELDFSDYIQENILGTSVKKQALQQSLPSFDAARKNAERFESLRPQLTESV